MDDRENSDVGVDVIPNGSTSLTKVCTKCGVEQELEQFYKTAKGRYGRSSQCKECKRKYYRINQDKYKARTKAYRENFMNSGVTCSVPNCDNPVVCKWYCDKHRSQIRNHGKILPRTKYDPNDIIVKGDVAEVILRDRRQRVAGRALIDAEDVPRVNKLHWHLKSYCVQAYEKEQGKLVTLSRFLLSPPDDVRIAYLNHDFMDNRKANLRVCTTQQIGIHRRIGVNNTSGVKGVSWNKKRQKWYVCLVKDGKHYWGGAFHHLADAVEARKQLEKEHFSGLVFGG